MSRSRAVVFAVLLAGGCGDETHDARACLDESSTTGENAALDIQASFRSAAAKASPAVVSVFSTKTLTIRGPHGARPGDPLYEFFREMPFPHPGQLQQTGLGSGLVLDSDGYVLTSHHIIAGAESIEVQLSDDRRVSAEVVGIDPPTDLALLRVDATGLETVELGDSDALEVGDWVLAIGDPFGLPRTVSAGIVSAKGRADVGIVEFEDFIQTDAAVNPGNSGGPLVDVEGRVVGINTAIATRSGGSAGIAFAIPSNMAAEIARDLRERGKVVRGHLGLYVASVPDGVAGSLGIPAAGGLLVQRVSSGSAAQAAGLQSGDIITRLDGEDVTSTSEFRVAIAARSPGTPVVIEIWRAGRSETLTATLGEAMNAGDEGGADERSLPGLFPRLGLPQTQSPSRHCDATTTTPSRREPQPPADRSRR
jgi:serine protease Do